MGQITTFCTTQFVEVLDPNAFIPETVYQSQAINRPPSFHGDPRRPWAPQSPKYERPQYQPDGLPGIRIEIRK